MALPGKIENRNNDATPAMVTSTTGAGAPNRVLTHTAATASAVSATIATYQPMLTRPFRSRRRRHRTSARPWSRATRMTASADGAEDPSTLSTRSGTGGIRSWRMTSGSHSVQATT